MAGTPSSVPPSVAGAAGLRKHGKAASEAPVHLVFGSTAASGTAFRRPGTGTAGWSQYLHADISRAAGALRTLHKDHLASNRMGTDAAGAVHSRSVYGPYGKPAGAAPSQSKADINERYGVADQKTIQ